MPQNIKRVVLEFPTATTFLGLLRDSALSWVFRLMNAMTRLRLNYITTSAALTIATTVQRVRTTASLSYRVNGVFAAALASTDNFWTLPATVVSISSIGAYILYINAAGTASAVSVAAVSGANPDLLDWPDPIDDNAIAGYITVATNGSTTFTGNTTALNAAGVTVTYFNGLPQQMLPRLTPIQ